MEMLNQNGGSLKQKAVSTRFSSKLVINYHFTMLI